MGDENNKLIEIKHFINKYWKYIDEATSISELIREYTEDHDEISSPSRRQKLEEDFKNKDQIGYEAENHIKWLISRLDRENFINLLQIKYTYQSYHNVEILNQFEIDYLYVMFLKYDGYKNPEKKFALQEYNSILIYILHLTRILFIFKQLQLNVDEQSLKISQYYRIRRFLSKKSTQLLLAKKFAEKLNQLKLDINFIKIVEWLINLSQLCIYRYKLFERGEVSLSDVFDFSLSDPSFINGLSEQELKLVLESFCIDQEAIKSQDDNDLFLINRIDSRFLECDGDSISLTNIGDIYNDFFSKIMKLFKVSPYQAFIEKANFIRDNFLENELSSLLIDCFGKEAVFVNSNWFDVNINGENDCLLVVDSVALIFEAKASSANDGIKKGLLKNIYQWNKQNIEVGLKQGQGFKTFIEKNLGRIITLKLKGGGENIIDLTNVSAVYNFVILLDGTPLQNLQCELLENKDLIAPVLTIFQLKDVLFNLKLITEKIDYLRKRFLIERSVRYFGDEEDFLYQYWVGGLNGDKKLYCGNLDDNAIAIISTQEKIDLPEQPDDFWRKYIKMNEEKKSTGWLKNGMSILELPLKAKKQILRDIKKTEQLILEDYITCRKKLIYVKRLNKLTIEQRDIQELTLRISDDIKTILFIIFNQNLSVVNIFVYDT